ncbi:MAG: hypothetical protein K8S27_07685 [Candidatus Omnitrophica bacterium]|nr:hypothetical protein [Candidatus Omnitrophota bacterium]
MVAKQETAEQKLLKMIEASAAKKSPTPEVQVEQKVKKKISFLTLIKRINLVLIIIVLFVGFELFRGINAGTQLLSRKLQLTATVKASSANLHQSNYVDIQQLAFYVAPVEERNIFQPYQEKSRTATDQSVEDIKKIVLLSENYRLVGVAWLDKIETASVMIEDTEKEITYFLHKGEKIGDIIVKTIYADSALLGYENEEMIIRYDKSQM